MSGTYSGWYPEDTITGVERLFGSLFDDYLVGDDNANTLNGSAGDDNLTGGGAADNFLFFFHNFDFGNDTITDFHLASTVAASDRLYLCPGDGVEMSAITVAGSDSGSNRVITITVGSDQKGTITLEGITSTSGNFANLKIGIPAADDTRASCEYSLTPPPAPTNLTLERGPDGLYTPVWDAPDDTTLTGYSFRGSTHTYPVYSPKSFPPSTSIAELDHDTAGSVKGPTFRHVHSPTDGPYAHVRTERNHVIYGAIGISNERAKRISRPATPENLSAVVGNTIAALTWDDPQDGAISTYQYSVWKGAEQVVAWTDIPGSGASTTSYRVTGLTNGTTYTIFLRAVAAGGVGIHSRTPAYVVATPTD